MDDLLSHYNKYSASNSVIIINNANIHYDPLIADAIRIRRYPFRYLPPYSSNYSPIEPSFSILKSWIRRRFYEIWLFFEGSFGDFLIKCVISSRCNRFGKAHFRHNNNKNYIFDGDLETFNRQFKIFERNQKDILKIDSKIK
jgi:transposase